MKQSVCLGAAAFLAVFLVIGSAPSAHAGDWPEDCGNNKSHNFFYGARSRNDRILYTETIMRSSQFLKKQSFDFDIPPKGQPRIANTITHIEIHDQFQNGDGGCAYLKSGGPGFNYVTLHLKSQRGEGINFIVHVYGN